MTLEIATRHVAGGQYLLDRLWLSLGQIDQQIVTQHTTHRLIQLLPTTVTPPVDRSSHRQPGPIQPVHTRQTTPTLLATLGFHLVNHPLEFRFCPRLATHGRQRLRLPLVDLEQETDVVSSVLDLPIAQWTTTPIGSRLRAGDLLTQHPTHQTLVVQRVTPSPQTLGNLNVPQPQRPTRCVVQTESNFLPSRMSHHGHLVVGHDLPPVRQIRDRQWVDNDLAIRQRQLQQAQLRTVTPLGNKLGVHRHDARLADRSTHGRKIRLRCHQTLRHHDASIRVC